MKPLLIPKPLIYFLKFIAIILVIPSIVLPILLVCLVPFNFF